MLAAFSMFPLGRDHDLGPAVAEVVRLVQDSGLDHVVGAMQTTVEGEPEEVFALLVRCHMHMRSGFPRIITRVTIDDRVGAAGRLTGKVDSVARALGKPLRTESA